MKALFLFCVVLLIPIRSLAQTTSPDSEDKLVKELQTDKPGTKTYVMALLKTGTNSSTDKAYRDSLYFGHIATINRLVSENKMVVVGPLTMNEYAYRSILVLNVSTVEEAKILLADDPAIRQDMFEVELYLWEGPITLPAYLIKPL
jgi:uncharacterized protein